MRTRIIVDSTADLMPEILNRVHVGPLTVHFGEEELVDGVTIDKKTFYERLIELGYLYKDLYEMTLQELVDTLEFRRKGLAYEIYRIASLCHSPFIKNFPSSPKEAIPELFPIEKGRPMPDFLKDKAIKRGVI